MSEITLYAAGRKKTRTWDNGNTATGYDVKVEQDGESTIGYFVAEAIMFGKRAGWVIVDLDTGKTIFGIGESTKIGPQRENALWLWQRKLNEQTD